MLASLLPIIALSQLAAALVQRDDVGKLPALGWNSWNAYNCDVDESKIMSAANMIVGLGLKDAGYQYVNIDDCWSVRSGRDPKTNRILVDTAKFPNGLTEKNSQGTAKRIHDMGLKIGIYSSAGTTTCAGFPASIDHETVDAQTWADWGIDYLKLDNCNVPPEWTDDCKGCTPDTDYDGPFTNGTCAGLTSRNNYCPSGYDFTKSKTAQRYNKMRDALQQAYASRSPILYSMCSWGWAEVWTWGKNTASSWRTTDDINTGWGRILEILNQNTFYLNYVDFWGHGDADMLEVGNIPTQQGRTHFALWAVMKSPLLIGTDLAKLNPTDLATLKNSYLLAFNQDKQFGKPAAPYKWGTNPDWTFDKDHPAEYWSGTSSQGVLLLASNFVGSGVIKSIRFDEVPELKGKGTSFMVIDAWDGRNYGCLTTGFDVQLQAYDTGVYLIQGSCTPVGVQSRSLSLSLRLRLLQPGQSTSYPSQIKEPKLTTPKGPKQGLKMFKA